MLRHRFLGLLVLFCLSSLSHSQDTEFLKEESTWRKERIERLTSETGWLTLVGLHWLKDGDNEFNTDPKLGNIVIRGNSITLTPRKDVKVTLNGKPFNGGTIRSDEDGKPDIVKVGSLSMTILRRVDRLALRVKDSDSPVRKNFHGIESYPPDPRYRVTAKYHPYSKAKELSIPTIVGIPEKVTSPGFVTFTLEGKSLKLEPVLEDPKQTEFFFIFKDLTNESTTYPSGRYLYSDLPKNGEVILHFNRAYNPPCAFTSFATCPLPPPANWLPVKIEAGEKRYGEH